MNIAKYFWALRAIFYKTRFKKFGNFSYIGRPLILNGTKKVQVGEKVRIYPGIRIEVHGEGIISIQDNVSIGQNLHLTSCDSRLVIGKDTTISANVLITNLDHGYQQVGAHILDQELSTKDTIIGENCFIGYGVVLQAGTILGKQCIVGANSVVRGEFPDYSVIAGSPARIVKRYDSVSNKWEKITEPPYTV